MELLSAFVLMAVIALFADQPATDRVILLPDADGKVGELTLSNQAGSQTINQAYMSIEARGESYLEDPKQLNKDAVDSNYTEVLSSVPKSASRYILYFTLGTTELTDESKMLITKISDDVKSREFYDVFIDGHTDTTGSSEKNYHLALERAQTVNKLFGDKLPKPDKVRVTSHGDGNLLVATEDDVDEPRNRRVEILIH